MTLVAEVVCAILAFLIECAVYYGVATWRTWRLVLWKDYRKAAVAAWSDRHPIYGMLVLSAVALVVLTNLILVVGLAKFGVFIATAN